MRPRSLVDLLVRLFPEDFRIRNQRELGLSIRDELVDCHTSNPIRRTWCIVRVTVDVVRSALSEHLKQLPRLKMDLRAADIVSDVRIAFRSLRRSPTTTLVAATTLALAIGVNTAIFTVVDTTILRDLPYAQPDDLVRVWRQSEDGAMLEMSYQDFRQLAERSEGFQALAAFSEASRVLSDAASYPINVGLARVTSQTFEVLRSRPLEGRIPSTGELERGDAVVVISDRLWSARYGRNPNVIDRTIDIEGTAHTIIGVMPGDYGYPVDADLWRPLRQSELEDDDPEYHVIGRKVTQTTLSELNSRLAVIAAGVNTNSGDQFQLWAQPLERAVVGSRRSGLLFLLAASGLVLVAACANIAGILLARNSSRARELAIRSALGARRGRITRLLLTESLLLGTMGLVPGILIGSATLDLVMRVVPPDMPRVAEISLDIRVVMVTMLVAALASIVFGIIPAIKGASRPPAEVLGAGTERHGASRAARRSRFIVTVIEVSLSTTLVALALVTTSTVSGLMDEKRGYRTEDIVVAPFVLPEDQPDAAALLKTELLSVPGVSQVTLGSDAPTSTSGLRLPVSRIPDDFGPESPRAQLRIADPDYADALNMRLVDGRFLEEGDQNTEPVVVITEALAKLMFAGEPAVGRTIHAPFIGALQVVGVLDDIRPDIHSDPFPQIYLNSVPGLPFRYSVALLRTDTEAATLVSTVRTRLANFNPDQPLDQITTVSLVVREQIRLQRFYMALFMGFAMLAVTLAATGLYGTMAGLVEDTRREFSVRRALGASELQVFRGVVGTGLRVVLIAAVPGLLLSQLTSGIMSRALETRAVDARTLIASVVVISIVGMIATVSPAIRALRANPVEALNH